MSAAQSAADAALIEYARALSSKTGFLRYDANLAVVVVSDAGDQSGDPYSYFYNRYMNIKGFNRASMFTFNDIGPYQSSAPSG